MRDLIEHDIPLRPKLVTGGEGGVRYGLGALHGQYQRVQWKDVDGTPAIREALKVFLPVTFSQSVKRVNNARELAQKYC